MNLKFEKNILDLFSSPDYSIVYDDELESLRGAKVAIDATLLLGKAAEASNPQKFIQEGGSSLDIQLQEKLIKIINKLRDQYKIELLIVIDGLMPKFVADRQ